MTTLPVSPSAAEQERLEACVREPIRRPGSIQSHGVLLTAERTTWTIVQASQNTDAFLGLRAEDLVGTPAAEVIGEGSVGRFSAVLAGARGASNPVPIKAGGADFDAIVHEADGVVVIELEPVLRKPLTVYGQSLAVTASVGVAVARDGDTASDLLRRADTSMYRAKRSGKNQAAG